MISIFSQAPWCGILSTFLLWSLCLELPSVNLCIFHGAWLCWTVYGLAAQSKQGSCLPPAHGFSFIQLKTILSSYLACQSLMHRFSRRWQECFFPFASALVWFPAIQLILDTSLVHREFTGFVLRDYWLRAKPGWMLVVARNLLFPPPFEWLG